MSDATTEPGPDERGPAQAADEPEAARAAEDREPAAPAPLGLARELTGHAGVDAHLARLAEVDHLPADGHLEVYEDVHRGLRAELTSLDAHPAPRPHDNRS